MQCCISGSMFSMRVKGKWNPVDSYSQRLFLWIASGNWRKLSSTEGPMHKSKFSEWQIAAALKEAEAGTPVADVCHMYGISPVTFHHWRSKYSGMNVSDLRRLRELEAECSLLERIRANPDAALGADESAVSI
jgi:putative transposase